jgi:hypothetical protein
MLRSSWTTAGLVMNQVKDKNKTEKKKSQIKMLFFLGEKKKDPVQLPSRLFG